MRFILQTALVLIFWFSAIDTHAQGLETPQARQGYYLGLGFGGAYILNIEKGDIYPGWPGGVFSFRLGQALNDDWALGILIDSNFGTDAEKTGFYGGLSIEAHWHTFSPMTIRMSAGFAVSSVREILDPDEPALGGVGDFYALGVSYDYFPLYESGSGGFALSPVIEFKAFPREGFASVLGWVGVDLTWWLGLPKNQLDLGVEDAFK